MTTLGERMKQYEHVPLKHIDGEHVLPNDWRPIVARIDGHNFSTFTRGFTKPFDPWLSHAMVETTRDLLQKFNATTGYTQSDEITLVFIPKKNEKTDEWAEWEFRGRAIKLATLLASYAAVRFNYHLLKQLALDSRERTEKVVDKITDMEAHFDARIFAVDNEMEAYNNVYWRSKYDCYRNAVQGLARQHFSTSEMDSRSCEEAKKMLLSVGVDFEDMPDAFKYGTFVKRKLVEIKATNQKTGKEETAMRTETVAMSLEKFTPTFIRQKYFQQDDDNAE